VAKYSFDLPDGTKASVDFPDEYTSDQVVSEISAIVGSFDKGATPTTGEINPKERFSNSYKLARGKSGFDSAMIAAGREFDSLGTGIRMWWNKATGDKDEYDKLVAENKQKNELMQPLREEHGVATAVGSMLPYFAASPSISVGGVKALGGLVPNIVKQGVGNLAGKAAGMMPKTAEGLKVIDALGIQAQNRALQSGVGSAATSVLRDPVKQGMALGGAIGAIHPDDTALTGALTGGVGAALGKTLLGPFSKKKTYLTEPQKNIVQEAKDLGIYLTPGTKTGDLRLGQLDRRFADNPAVSQMFRARELQNNATISRHIARKLGLPDTPIMDADYLHGGFKHFGSIMDKVAERSKVKFDRNDVIKLHDLIEEYNKYPGTSKLAADWKDYLYKSLGIKKQVVSMKGGKKVTKTKFNFKGGELPGKEYQEISTRLNQQIGANLYSKEGDRALGGVLYKIKNLLDDTLEKGSHSADVDLLKYARKGYSGLELVRKSSDANSGFVDLTKLYQNMTNKNVKSQYERILGDDLFAKLGRIGKLKQETRAKVDLATANISRSLLNESPSQLRSIYKWASMGMGDVDPRNTMAKLRTNLYLSKSGWPAASGFFPVIKPETSDMLQKMFARATMGDSTPEDEGLGLFGR